MSIDCEARGGRVRSERQKRLEEPTYISNQLQEVSFQKWNVKPHRRIGSYKWFIMQIQAFLKKTFGRNLFFTNVGISFGLSGVGDLIEQKIEKRQQAQQNSSGNLVKKVSSINWSRTLHMSTAFGLTSGFLCHFWYNYLDRMLPGRGVRVIVQKIAWDQVK